jgi:hypothetical protein
VKEKGVFWVKVGKLVALVVIVSGEEVGVTAKVKAAVAVFAGLPESVTMMLVLKVPETVGVPAIIPLAAPSVSPAGSAPDAMLQANGATPPAFWRV